MVYGFVKQSGGHVKLYSEVGEGTAVKLYLPRATGNTQSARVPETARHAHPMGNETILVVEDNEDVRAYVVIILGVLGYNVIEAEDGPAALNLLNDIPHLDLLLTDMVMPHGMNGLQVAEAVQKHFPQAKVLYTSGFTENAIVHHGYLGEAAELLAKPYTRAILAQKLRAVLDAPQD